MICSNFVIFLDCSIKQVELFWEYNMVKLIIQKDTRTTSIVFLAVLKIVKFLRIFCSVILRKPKKCKYLYIDVR